MVGFLVIVWVSRVLSPEALGELSFAQSAVAYVLVLADLGLTSLAVREMAQRPAFGRQIALGTLAAQSVAGVLGMATLVTATELAPLSPAIRALTAAYVLTVLAQSMSLAFVFQAEERMVQLAMFRFLSQGAGSVVALVGLILTRNLLAVPLGMAAVGLTCDIAIILRLGVSRHAPLPSRRFIAQLIVQGLPFLAAGLTVQVLVNFDALVVGVLRGAAELGRYSAAYRLVILGGALPGIIMTMAYPRFSRLAGEPRGFSAAFDGVAEFMGRFGLLAGCSLLIAGRDLIDVIFGPNYPQSVAILQILSAVILLMPYNTLIGQALQSSGRQRAQMTVAVVAATVNVVATLGLVAAYGIVGAALANVASEITTTAIGASVARASYRLSGLRAYLWQPSVFVLAAIMIGIERVRPWAGSARLIVIFVGCLVVFCLPLVWRTRNGATAEQPRGTEETS